MPDPTKPADPNWVARSDYEEIDRHCRELEAGRTELRNEVMRLNAIARDLGWRVVHNAGGARCAERLPRWAHVKDATGLGSTAARELCREHGCDPDEYVGVRRDD